jgi:hypothetical protein
MAARLVGGVEGGMSVVCGDLVPERPPGVGESAGGQQGGRFGERLTSGPWSVGRDAEATRRSGSKSKTHGRAMMRWGWRGQMGEARGSGGWRPADRRGNGCRRVACDAEAGRRRGEGRAEGIFGGFGSAGAEMRSGGGGWRRRAEAEGRRSKGGMEGGEGRLSQGGERGIVGPFWCFPSVVPIRAC